MREAAFEIARQSDDFAPTIAKQMLQAIRTPLKALADSLKLMQLRARLSQLDDRQLDDIGLIRADIDLIGATNEPAATTLARLRAKRRVSGWACYNA